MVAKISSGTNLYGALKYNQEKVDKGEGKVLGANLVFEPEAGNFNINDCLRDFMQCIPNRYHTEKILFHVSLNPHPNDILSNEQLEDIGWEYMEKLGYGNQPFLIFKHEDIDRKHLHIVSLRVDSNGKKINDSNEHIRSKEITEEIEQKYNLHPAEGQKRAEIWQFTPVNTSKGDLKKQMSSVVKPIAAMYHFQSMGEYKAVLSFYNIHVEELKGEVKGQPYRGLLYCALDSNGDKFGTPLKSSLFGKSIGYDALEKRMEKSAELIKTKKLKENSLKIVSDAKANCKTESEFRAKLKQQGIDILFRRNDEGRIYGATFIDHKTRTVLNGSRLGKEFSANVFNELFNNQGNNTGEQKTDIPISQAENTEQTKQNNNQQSAKHSENENVSDSDLGGLFSVIIPEYTSQSDDNVPNPYRKKKKKRKFGRQL